MCTSYTQLNQEVLSYLVETPTVSVHQGQMYVTRVKNKYIAKC